MFDPAATADFDQAHATVRDAVDGLIESLMCGARRCPCGEPIDSQRHTLVLVGLIREQYRPEMLSMLFAEAVTRLAIARGAK
ncbi:hypothetical protein Ntsu_04270 [Nocardia sp. IFM 10818]